MLEAMNRGASSSGGSSMMGTMVNVTVENYGNSSIEVERIGENDIRIIAREVVDSAISNDVPRLMGAEVANPNSNISKSLARNTNTQRRR